MANDDAFTMIESPAIQIDGLSKRYGDRTVVDAMSATIPRGAVAGFIGPNGAGKTTTMAMLLGLVRPTSGTAMILGEPISAPEKYMHRIGALLEGPALWPTLTGAQNLRVLAKLGGHDTARIPEVLALVNLEDRADERFGRYSLGMKQRLGVAAALLGDPELVILDEPTNGLDPVGIRDMRSQIQAIASQDRTVLISSHILSELEHVCDWLIVIDVGRVVYTGPAADFLRAGDDRVTLVPVLPSDLVSLERVVESCNLCFERSNDTLVVTIGDTDVRITAAALNRAAFEAGVSLAEVRITRPDLESSYYGTLSEVQK
jgi:ABC-2 type transport system ATP-binding protein